MAYVKKDVVHFLCFDHNYTLIRLAIHASNTVQAKTIQIQLEKEGQSYGFILRGGASDDKAKSRPLIITKIRPQGPADKYEYNIGQIKHIIIKWLTYSLTYVIMFL